MSVRSEFDIFAHKPVQKSVLETIETIFRTIASVEKSDLEFFIPAENDPYIDLNFNLFVTVKLTAADGKAVEETDYIAVKNILHSLFNPL